MSSPEKRGEQWFIGKQCYECINCGTLIEFEWHQNDECSCEEKKMKLEIKNTGEIEVNHCKMKGKEYNSFDNKRWVSLDSLNEWIINHETELNFEMELLQALGGEEE